MSRRKVQIDVELKLAKADELKNELKRLTVESKAMKEIANYNQQNNKSIKEQNKQSAGLLTTTKRLVAGYLGFQAAKKTLYSVAEIDKYLRKTEAFAHANEKQMKMIQKSAIDTSESLAIPLNEVLNSVMYMSQQMPVEEVAKNLKFVGEAMKSIPNATFQESADMVMVLNNVFKHTGQTIQEMVSDAVAGMDSAGMSIQELNMFLQNAGATAGQFKQSLSSVIATAGALKKQGIGTAIGGTATKNIMNTLLVGDEKTAKKLAQYGITFKKNSKEGKDFLATLEALAKATEKLTEEQRNIVYSDIFGSYAGVATALSSAQGRQILQQTKTNMGRDDFMSKTAKISMQGVYGELSKIQTIFSNIPALFMEVSDELTSFLKIVRKGLEISIELIKALLKLSSFVFSPIETIKKAKEEQKDYITNLQKTQNEQRQKSIDTVKEMFGFGESKQTSMPINTIANMSSEFTKNPALEEAGWQKFINKNENEITLNLNLPKNVDADIVENNSTNGRTKVNLKKVQQNFTIQ